MIPIVSYISFIFLQFLQLQNDMRRRLTAHSEQVLPITPARQ